MVIDKIEVEDYVEEMEMRIEQHVKMLNNMTDVMQKTVIDWYKLSQKAQARKTNPEVFLPTTVSTKSSTTITTEVPPTPQQPQIMRPQSSFVNQLQNLKPPGHPYQFMTAPFQNYIFGMDSPGLAYMFPIQVSTRF